MKDSLKIEDVRNKLSPIVHVLRMIEIGETDRAIASLKNAQDAVNYLAQREVYK